MQLADRVALVTGAGSGIGKAAAMLLAEQGAKVGVLSHTAGEIEQTAEEIRSAGGEGVALVGDIADAGGIRQAIDELARRWGRLDILFANAGINGVWAPIEELETKEWDRTLSTNLSGTFYTIKHAVPHLKKNGGSIIVTASVNGTRMFSNTGATAYACSKAGQAAMVKMLAPELGPQGIRINVICPGAIDTEIDDNTDRRDLDDIGLPVEFPKGKIPLGGKPGSSRQVAQLVLFLASDASSHITGTEVWIDGAQSLLQG